MRRRRSVLVPTWRGSIAVRCQLLSFFRGVIWGYSLHAGARMRRRYQRQGGTHHRPVSRRVVGPYPIFSWTESHLGSARRQTQSALALPLFSFLASSWTCSPHWATEMRGSDEGVNVSTVIGGPIRQGPYKYLGRTSRPTRDSRPTFGPMFSAVRKPCSRKGARRPLATIFPFGGGYFAQIGSTCPA